MILKRRVNTQLNRWFEYSKNALLVEGARQVGKTYAIRNFLEEKKIDYVEINLVDVPDAIDVLEQARDVDELVLGLSTITDKIIRKGETVIFIDEVQKYKEMVTKIKFLVDEGSFRYILSGSMLGVELTGLESAPVGYLDIIYMYPLDFTEFLWTSEVWRNNISYLKECFDTKKPVMYTVHRQAMDFYTRYLMVGGMPAAVSEFVETGNINDVMKTHKNIKELYKLDFTKYEEENKKLSIIQIYDVVPSELLKQNRRFIISDLGKGKKYDRLENSFLWLEKAGVTLGAYNATEPRVPLKLNKKHSLFKLYLSDVGMLTSEYGMNTKRMLLTGDSKLNLGGIYENAVAQELRANGHDIYYYNSKKLGELDFVIEFDGRILPIEVKSGKDYMVHSAINNCLNHPEFEIDNAIVLGNCNVEEKDNILYLPIYMAMFLKEDDADMVLEIY